MDGEVVRPGELAAAQPALEGPGAGMSSGVAGQLVTPADVWGLKTGIAGCRTWRRSCGSPAGRTGRAAPPCAVCSAPSGGSSSCNSSRSRYADTKTTAWLASALPSPLTGGEQGRTVAGAGRPGLQSSALPSCRSSCTCIRG